MKLTRKTTFHFDCENEIQIRMIESLLFYFKLNNERDANRIIITVNNDDDADEVHKIEKYIEQIALTKHDTISVMTYHEVVVKNLHGNAYTILKEIYEGMMDQSSYSFHDCRYFNNLAQGIFLVPDSFLNTFKLFTMKE